MHQLSGRLVALTELPVAMEFDETLDTVGPVEWKDAEEGVMSTAHPLKLEDGRSLNLLTVNAMVAAHSVLIPLQSEFFALEGLSQLMLTIREVRQSANPKLRIEGVLLTMVDARNNLSAQVESDARENLGDLVFQTRIPRNVRVSEAPSYALPVLTYDPASKGAQAYRDLALEIVQRHARAAA